MAILNTIATIFSIVASLATLIELQAVKIRLDSLEQGQQFLGKQVEKIFTLIIHASFVTFEKVK